MTETTTVKEFIAYLQTLPQDANVTCLTADTVGYETRVRFQNLKISDHVYVCDLRGNSFVKKDDPNFGKVFVEIGEEK